MINPGDATLLGAPLPRYLCSGPELDHVWSDRCDDLWRAVSRLHHLCTESSSPHAASHSSLDQFDLTLRSVVQYITNCDLSHIQWMQTSLRVNDGGVGVRRMSSLSRIPAFLASGASTLPPGRYPVWLLLFWQCLFCSHTWRTGRLFWR